VAIAELDQEHEGPQLTNQQDQCHPV